MDNIVDYCESSSPEESDKERDAAVTLPKTDGSDRHSKSSSTDSSSSEDELASPKTVQQQKRPNHRERSRSRSPQRHNHRPLPYRRNSYGRRSRSGSRERDRRRRSRSSSRDRDMYRRRRSRSGSQERRRRSSRSRSPDRRGRYNRSPRQYRRSPPSRYRRSGRSRSRSPVSSRRYPSTPVVTAHTLSRNASGGDALSGSLSNIPGETPEQKLENALTTMNQRQARYGGMTALQFQAVQEKRKQLWKKKTPANAATQWDAYAATFGQPSTAGNSDSNEDPQAKFRRLMGMKGDSQQQPNQDVTQKSSEIINKQNKLLADLDQQYEESRFLTHRARGVGFGFGGSILSSLSKTQDVVNEKGPEDK